MPDQPDVSAVAPRGVVDLSGAPAALDDATFDALFPADGVSRVTPAPQVQSQGTPPAAPQTPIATATQTPAATPTDDVFLKGERSLYKTKEAALEGLNQKDALIEQLRQRYSLTTGIDPITGQPVGQAALQSPQQIDYQQNPNQYLDDLYKAAKEGGAEGYRNVQAKFILDLLKPIAPILQNTVRQQAVKQVTSEIAGFDTFVGTPAFGRALDANPQLKDAISTAESDFRFQSQLPGLYKTAYLVAQGMQLPEILQAQTVPRQAQTQTQTPHARPTVTPSTPSAPTQTVAPNLRTIDGIRSIIADAEARGVKLDF